MTKLTLNFLTYSIFLVQHDWYETKFESLLPWRHFWIAHASFWHGSLLLLDIPPTNLPLYSLMPLIKSDCLSAGFTELPWWPGSSIGDLGSTVYSASFWTFLIVEFSADIGLILFPPYGNYLVWWLLTARGPKVWPPLINSHSIMQRLTNQKLRSVSSWLLIGLNLHKRMWINQSGQTFGLFAVKAKSCYTHFERRLVAFSNTAISPGAPIYLLVISSLFSASLSMPPLEARLAI